MKNLDCFLHVEDCHSGETFIMPMRVNSKFDLKHQVKRWVKRQYAGELELDGELIPKLEGDFYARIMTDGHSPNSIVCCSGGFYLKDAGECR